MTITSITLREYTADLYGGVNADTLTRHELRTGARRILSKLPESVPTAPTSGERAAYIAEADFLVGVAIDCLSSARHGGVIGPDAERVWRTACAVRDLIGYCGTANQLSHARKVADQCRAIQLAAEALATNQRAASAKGWDEGYADGVEAAERWRGVADPVTNPYRDEL